MLKEVDNSRRPTRLFDYVTPYFTKVANAIKSLEGRLQVEVIYGELVDVCEKLRFGLHGDQDDLETKAIELDGHPKGFRVSFDRIYLSNVP
jgi:hypothetical protein